MSESPTTSSPELGRRSWFDTPSAFFRSLRNNPLLQRDLRIWRNRLHSHRWWIVAVAIAAGVIVLVLALLFTSETVSGQPAGSLVFNYTLLTGFSCMGFLMWPLLAFMLTKAVCTRDKGKRRSEDLRLTLLSAEQIVAARFLQAWLLFASIVIVYFSLCLMILLFRYKADPFRAMCWNLVCGVFLCLTYGFLVVGVTLQKLCTHANSLTAIANAAFWTVLCYPVILSPIIVIVLGLVSIAMSPGQFFWQIEISLWLTTVLLVPIFLSWGFYHWRLACEAFDEMGQE